MKHLIGRGRGMDEVMIGKELHSLNNMIRRFFDFSSHKKEIETITGNNGWIIGYLADHESKDIYQKDLESYFSITRSTASKVLRLMEEKGLIQRQAVACDARLKKIILTDKAWKLHILMKEDLERMERTLTKGFMKEELLTLQAYIQRMKENITNIKSDPT
jgi:DNA-binding MarR family transcriptional regulator